jgi:predicted small lipoprotein YifL
MRRLTIVACLVLPLLGTLGGCGQKGDLKRPQSAKSVPVPYGRDQPPTTAALMKPSPQAAPARDVELMTKSEPRPDDPFNLPPKD